MIFPIEFKNNLGLTLCGYIHKPKKYDTAIVFLHGFPGTMHGTAARLLNIISKKGFLCLRFNFSGTDTSEGKFEQKHMGQEVKDIKYAINFLEKNYSFKKIILIGISTGAIDASLYAYKDKRISKVILLSAVSDLKHAARYDFTDRQIHQFWKKGYIIYGPGKWFGRKRLNKSFYDEFFTLDIPKAIKKYHRPLLIVHGSKDESVPVWNAKELFRIANHPKKLVIIKNSDHRFSKKIHQMQLLWHIYRFIRK